MKKTSFYLVLLVLILFSCNATKNKIERNQMKATENNPSSFMEVNGLKMYYEVHGQGNPLVLIHGGGSTIQTTFGRILATLAKTNKVIAVEMQAHGHTADRDTPLAFEQDADDIASLLQQLNIKKASIFGFSNGASTTLQFAIRHPEMTHKIIVASTFYKKSGAPDWFWDMMSKPSFESMPQIYKDEFLKINPDTIALHQMYKRDVQRMQTFTNISEEQIKSIKVPTLIVIGDTDVVTPEHAIEMQKFIPNSELAIVPGGHGTYMGEITTLKPNYQETDFVIIPLINNFLAKGNDKNE
ncbi:alpha/beta fold hydrolase [Mariniflexile gromovii]|uniref:Alpha/beta hydrolase n=1 Tax=Mariniflexile gromovii TaxID=362523 RepID=A0ABS4BUH5_9FLAO|nr:alpha/beta hydrolase [Mariniflexile gromovii]MBP0904238.1 alpha/beta hydrolase [Mariniflexile gromovii]